MKQTAELWLLSCDVMVGQPLPSLAMTWHFLAGCQQLQHLFYIQSLLTIALGVITLLIALGVTTIISSSCLYKQAHVLPGQQEPLTEGQPMPPQVHTATQPSVVMVPALESMLKRTLVSGGLPSAAAG